MKKTIRHLAIPALALAMFWSCGSSEKHFLKDEQYRKTVNQEFLERKELAKGRSAELFSVFDREDVTLEEKEALEFLYAYMPLSDLADYDGDYYLKQVRAAFAAREYFDWGKTVPDDLFRHFVLVQRVNNENLDDARGVFFDELKERVKGMTMEEAVLEVNHWCHEKITYRATDGRTSSPLALMKTSWGRCGEQSTFTTMALRSVGIPARQCYTPRWVHSDDNHAWVEAWVDGKWRYIGASEPEAELDIAWFNGPAKRAIMVHTNVFGKYQGPEDKTLDEKLYSVINVLDTYADTRRFSVQILDTDGTTPVEGAEVAFEVYNYAEFYPIAKMPTNKDGKVELKTNAEGDIVIWAKKGDKFASMKVGQTDLENKLVLGTKMQEGEDVFTMHVPPVQPIRELTAEQIAQNAIRLAKEDSIRNAYMSTFIKEDVARKLATDNKLDADKVWNFLSLSQGNWKDVSEFIVENKDNALLLEYLGTLSEKDLRDTPKDYLANHLQNAEKVGVKANTPKDMYAKYIYSPRIANELIRPWRTFLQDKFTKEDVAKYQGNPASLIEFVKGKVKITDTDNYYKCPVSPRGVFELELADKQSRDIFTVALYRSLGIPSRLEPSTSRPQYYENNQWKDVLFEATGKELPKGNITFSDDKENIVRPAYYAHYTIARFDGNSYSTLDFTDDANLKALPGTVSVDAGYYRLTIGSRANDGSVRVLNRYFEVKEGETISEVISLPKPEGLLQVQGTIDPNTIVELDSGVKSTIKEQMFGKGLLLVFSDPDREPTKHILQDLPLVKDALDQWGGGIVFMVPDDKISSAFDASAFSGLPTKATWATDNGRKILKAAASALQIDFSNNFPLVLYINTNGGILYSHQGYTIGIGEDILKVIDQEKLICSM